jgi:hypothetical protein
MIIELSDGCRTEIEVAEGYGRWLLVRKASWLTRVWLSRDHGIWGSKIGELDSRFGVQIVLERGWEGSLLLEEIV